MPSSPSPQRRLEPRGVKNSGAFHPLGSQPSLGRREAPFTPWDPSLRWEDGTLDPLRASSESGWMARGAAKPGKAKKKGGLAETTRFLLLLFLFAIVLRTFVVAPFMIPSGSM